MNEVSTSESRDAPEIDAIQKREIVAIVSVGCGRRTAADYVGTTVATIRREARRNREFARQLCRGERNQELQQLQHLQKAAEKHWQASAWMLERRYPELYGKRDPRQLTIPQVAQLLAELAEIIVAEVRDDGERQGILTRLKELTTRLEAEMEDRRLAEEFDS